MNGQMYQICCIAAAAKRALLDKTEISYIPTKYENRIEFQLLPERKLFGKKSYQPKDLSQWFEHCVKRGLQDIKMLAPVTVENRALLGFANTTQGSLVCFYKGKTTYFTAQWEFDSEHSVWNILYTEHDWKDAPDAKPRFDNNIESFKAVLTEIKELACKIDCQNFADIFQKAIDILLGSTDYTDTAYNLPLPQIPEENLCLFEAASTADVFGAMGSWNDSPPYMAHEKGLDKEYDALSDELLKQIRLATLYAVNEWRAGQ